VPAWVIEEPERLTVGVVDRETNQEVRRCMIEIIGLDRHLLEAGAGLVAEDDCGRLWRRATRLLVEAVNGTVEPDGSRRRYLPDVTGAADEMDYPINTARAAVAATYGLRPDHYEVAIRT
jgi:hypothetical protein